MASNGVGRQSSRVTHWTGKHSCGSQGVERTVSNGIALSGQPRSGAASHAAGGGARCGLERQSRHVANGSALDRRVIAVRVRRVVGSQVRAGYGVARNGVAVTSRQDPEVGAWSLVAVLDCPVESWLCMAWVVEAAEVCNGTSCNGWQGMERQPCFGRVRRGSAGQGPSGRGSRVKSSNESDRHGASGQPRNRGSWIGS